MPNSNPFISSAAVITLHLVFAGSVMLAPACAQQPDQLSPGMASTLPLNNNARAQRGAGASGTLTAIPDDFADLKLAPGFLLDVQVFDEPQFASKARVDQQGEISVPLIGGVHVAGMTVAEAEKAIQEKLVKDEILTNPQVTLNVEQYAGGSVTVLGEVQNPGRIQLLAPHNLLDVIGMAGGETNIAGQNIEVKSPGKDGPINHTYQYSRSGNGNSIRDVMIQPGDTVTVDRAGIVYVLGAVNRPGGYVMQEDGKLDVAQALSLAQGTTLQAQVGSLRVVRQDADGQVQTIPLSYKGIMHGKVKPLVLQAQDIVYVDVSKLKTFFTSTTNVLGQAGSAAIIAKP